MEIHACKLVLADKGYNSDIKRECPNYYKNASSIGYLISYIFRVKDNGVRYAGALNLGYGKISDLEKRIKMVQKLYGKDKGRRMYHYILSFSGNYIDEDARQLFEVAETIVNRYFRNTQIVYAVHEDKKHLHVHFAFSAVQLNGRKWNCRKKDFKELKNAIETDAIFGMCGKRNVNIYFDDKKEIKIGELLK